MPRRNSSTCSRERSGSVAVVIARRSPGSRGRLPAAPDSRALSSRRMILPERVLGGCRKAISRGATAARRLRAWPRMSRSSASDGSKPGLARRPPSRSARGLVRLANDRRLHHRRMLDQRALHLERADAVAGTLDHVVRRARRTSSSRRRRASRGRRSDTSRRQSTWRSAPPRGSVRTSRGGSPAAAARSRRPGRGRLARGRSRYVDEARFDSREWPAHRARPDVRRGGELPIRTAGLRLPVVFVQRDPDDLRVPDHAFRVQRFADAGEEAKASRNHALAPPPCPRASSVESRSERITRPAPARARGCRTSARGRISALSETIVTRFTSGEMMP